MKLNIKLIFSFFLLMGREKISKVIYKYIRIVVLYLVLYLVCLMLWNK